LLQIHVAGGRDADAAGGWTTSMTGMRMHRQTRVGAAESLLGMCIGMMMEMMLPSPAPMLLGYRQAIPRTGEMRLGRLVH
jgi:predicted metal-binding membrane protein